MVKAAASPTLELIRRAVEDQRVRELPDQELLQRFHAQQDQVAFHAVLRRHGPMVLDVCRGVLGNEADAEDAFQATFLILAGKAGSIRKSASLGSWLHGVAYRTALKARARSVARQKHEACLPGQASEPHDLSWREVRQAIHEEVCGLPERYRTPLVLCYLEGATQEAAAIQLKLAKSTLRERLERGRTFLRTRLLRRGLGPAALLVAAVWPAANASACVPISVVTSTIKAASLIAAGKAVAQSAISAQVAALTEAMLLTKLKIATAFLVIVPLLVGAGAVGYYTQATEQFQAAENPRSDEDNDPSTFNSHERSFPVVGKDRVETSLPMMTPEKMDSSTADAHAPNDTKAVGIKALPPGLARKAADHPGRVAWSKANE